MKRALLLALPLALAATAFWLLSGSDERADGEVRAGSVAPRTAEQAEPVTATATTDRRAESEGQGRTGTEATESDREPVPADATWVEVLVTADELPVAGAEVYWMNEGTGTRAQKALKAGKGDLQTLWRRQDEVARRFGWHTRSDDRGMARLHLSNWTSVFAWHDGRYGTVVLQGAVPPPPGGHRLVLEADLELRVQVVDGDGAPVTGVPIQVMQHDAAGKLVDSMVGLAKTEAPDGTARLQHLQTLSNRPWGSEARIAEWRVRPHLVGSTDPGVRFDPKAPPAETIVLHLPAFGRARARVEYRGRPFGASEDTIISLYCGAPDDWRARMRAHWQAITADGWAHFDWIPLGVSLTAAAGLGSVQVLGQAAGPVRAGEEVSIVLAPTDDQVLVTGRAVDEQRQPLRQQRIAIEIRHKDWGNTDSLRTDGEGRFQLLAARPAGTERFERVSVMLRDEDVDPLRGDVEPRDVTGGELDVGDVVLAKEPLVVSGRLVTGEQPYRRRIDIQVERLVQGREGRERWENQRAMVVRQDDQGHFTVRGRIGEGRLRLSFPAWGLLPVAPIEFRPGATDVQVQIDPGSALVATFLLPPDAEQQLHALLRPDPGVTVPPATGRFNDRLAADVWSWTSRPQAVWSGLPSGNYTLEVRLPLHDEPLLEIASVQVPPPENGDPRLFDIDLREALAVIRLTLVAADTGAPVTASGIVFAMGSDTSRQWRAVLAQSSPVRIVSRRQPLDLLVAPQGYRPQELRSVRSDTEVRLERWPEIELVFADLPPLPPGTQLFASLTAPQAERDGGYKARWGTGKRSDHLRPEEQKLEVRDGRVRLRIGDGMHRLEVSLRKGEQSFRVEGATPVEVGYRGVGAVPVLVPAQALQRALERPAK